MSTGKPAKKRCSIRDIAKYLNLSPGTVSRVLNNKSSNVKITEATKKRVFAAAKELNYSPNIHAKRLFSNKSMTIGILTPIAANMVAGQHFFADYNLAETISGIEQVATASKYHMLLISRTDEFIASKSYLNLFREKSIDGMIIWGTSSDCDFVKDMQEEDLPVVLANSDNIYTPAIRVTNDNKSGSFELTKYLIDKGYKKIAYINGKEMATVNIDRKKGFEEAMAEHNIAIAPELILQGDFSIESGYSTMESLLKSEVEIDAVIAANDMMAIGAMRAILNAGKRIPEDIAVAGADNIQLAEYANIPLTTYSTNMFNLGVESMNLLIKRMNNESDVPHKMVLPTELIIREST